MFAREAASAPRPEQPWDPLDAFGSALDELIAPLTGGPAPEMDVRSAPG